MTKEQEQAIQRFQDLYQPKEEFLAALLAGSLAHGYAHPSSDVDIILVATEAEWQRRQTEGGLTFSLWDLCEYEGGYIDVKVTSWNSLEDIRQRGSDPARFAFQDARVLYSRLDGLEEQLRSVSRFPVPEKETRRHRFLCQLLAWKWYLSQGETKANRYLITLAVQKIVLFASRLILNENERLFPYHKWLLAETERAARRPDVLLLLNRLLEAPAFSTAQEITDRIFAGVGRTERETDWPSQFLRDSELNWLDHEAPVEDV